MGILRLPLQDVSGVWLRGLKSLWHHLLWLKSCCCSVHRAEDLSVLSIWSRDESCCLVSSPRVGPALAGGNGGVVRCPQNCPRATTGACLNSSTLSSRYLEQGSPSPNMEDKTLLSQSTPLLAEFCSSVIKTRGTAFWLRNSGRGAAPSEWEPLPGLHQTEPLSCRDPAQSCPWGEAALACRSPHAGPGMGLGLGRSPEWVQLLEGDEAASECF